MSNDTTAAEGITWEQIRAYARSHGHPPCEDPECGMVLRACKFCDGPLELKMFLNSPVLSVFCARGCNGDTAPVAQYRLERGDPPPTLDDEALVRSVLDDAR